ncbi:hypothetical protein O181_022268 [Austropuccinia psidii MF-1]|uniref:SNF2 N-terminal domain-containing protein n=1 Tax=Austropuccinia psidii MF-1 TaxID=1389203 RepID=A0A9Q3CEV7_9BASI|nr:hypothetical protein [Austropuccinia psidii MF-1]
MEQSTQYTVYLPNHQHTIGSLLKTLSKMLITFLVAPQTFMHCGPGGAWSESFQSNPTQALFVEEVFMTSKYDPSSCQNPNLALMTLTWYPNILLMIESFRKQYYKPKILREYYGNSHSQCQDFTPTSPASKLTAPLPSHDDPTPFHDSNPLLPHQKTRLAFLWDQEMPNGKSASNLWATSPPGSTFNSRHIITNRVVSSFQSLLTNTPLGGLLADDMGLGKTIQAIALIGTSKEGLITNP